MTARLLAAKVRKVSVRCSVAFESRPVNGSSASRMRGL